MSFFSFALVIATSASAQATVSDSEEMEQDLPSEAEVVALMEASDVSREQAEDVWRMQQQQRQFEASLTPETGSLTISEGRATLTIPDGYGFLDAGEADRVLQAWGNPPGGGREGMIISTEVSLFSAESWAALVSYEEMGHVDDDDAGEIDWGVLLAEMQSSDDEANAERRALGLSEVRTSGWAEPPHYDADANRLYWATLLADSAGNSSVNYDVRVLGRQGVLVLSAIAEASAMPSVKPAMEDVITFASFNDGHRYLDFDPEIDDVAAAGLGALVAGKVATKTGLLAVLTAVLLKAKKLLIVGLVAAAAGLRRLFFGGAAAKPEQLD